MAQAKGMSTQMKTGLGVAAAIAAAAAGTYFFYGSADAGKNRKKLKGWMVKAKGEVLEQIENMTDVTKEGYEAAVMQVMDKYKTVKNIPTAELIGLGNELRRHWKAISTSAAAKSRSPKKVTAKKTTTKAKR